MYWWRIKRGALADEASAERAWEDFSYAENSTSVNLYARDMLVTFVTTPRKLFGIGVGNYSVYQLEQAGSVTVPADTHYTVLSATGASTPDILYFIGEDDEVLGRIEEPPSGVGQLLLLALCPKDMAEPEIDPYAPELGF